MKNLITALLLLFTIPALAQTKTEKQNPWKIGIAFSPDAYLNSTSIEISGYSGYDMEHSIFNFTTGLVAQLTISPKLELGTGFLYSNKDLSGTYYCYVCDFIMAPQPERIKLRFVEMPLFLRYNVLNEDVRLHIETGLKGSLLTNEINTDYEGTLSTNNFLLSGEFGVGINRDLSERTNFSLSTIYTHSLNTFSDTEEFTFRSFSLKTAVVYTL